MEAKESKRFDIAIIGAGIVGCSVARELTRWNLSVCVIDRASDVAAATSRANSGIVHAGFDAKHGSLKARYNVEGSRLYPKLAAELGFTLKINGSLVLAFTDEELESLQNLLANGIANGVEGLEILNAEQVRSFEPNVSPDARAALHAPTGGITNPYEATLAFAENAIENGAEFMLDTEIDGVQKGETGFVLNGVRTLDGARVAVEARCVINAAGIYADRIAALTGQVLPEITARRGEYLILDKRAGGAFIHTMFRAPSAVGKGVLVSPTVDGNIIVGPNAHPVDRDAEGGSRDTTQEGIAEIAQKARDIWPDLQQGQAIARFAGLRATPANGDFTVAEAEDCPGWWNLSGIESPGLTAAPAIAVDVAHRIAEKLNAKENEAFNPVRIPRKAYTHMDAAERTALIEKDPAWGRMVCRCEQVTEAEIRAEVHAPIPAITLDAIKWRTRAGMGRCHAGFCSPYVARIIAEEAGIPIDEVRKGEAGTRVTAAQGAVKSGPLGYAEGIENESFEIDASAEIVIVGGGAGGIAAALAAKRAGVETITLLDREDNLGGILKQCIHPGFGLDRYSEELTGPEYAARDEADLASVGIEVLKRTTATAFHADGQGGYLVEATGPQGAFNIAAKSVVLATGSRERSAGQIDLNGDRPAGVYTAGCAQNFMNLMGTLPGREIVIYGSGDIGLIMARRLAWEGAHVKAVVERAKRPKGLRRNVKQCLEDNDIPILLSQSVVRVFGKDRVEGVELVHTDKETKRPIPGTEYRMDCDTLLLSCGLIPEQDLLAEAGGSPISRGSCETDLPGVYLCGNASQIHDIVDSVTAEGEYVGACAAAYVLGTEMPEAPEIPDEGAAAVASAAIFDALPEGFEAITCICCPKGCEMAIGPRDAAPELTEKEAKFHLIEDYYVQGNICKRGLTYAFEEKTAPQRTLTSIVRAANRLEPVSVRTDRTIPKSSIPACLEVLKGLTVEGPLSVGDVIVEDICGTGANIVATKALI